MLFRERFSKPQPTQLLAAVFFCILPPEIRDSTPRKITHAPLYCGFALNNLHMHAENRLTRIIHQPPGALVIVWPHARLPGVCQSFSGRNGVT